MYSTAIGRRPFQRHRQDQDSWFDVHGSRRTDPRQEDDGRTQHTQAHGYSSRVRFRYA